MTGDGYGEETAIPWARLVDAALSVRRRAHAPYTSFAVGAAIATDDGELFAGCNVESRALPLSVCAERNALTTAVAAGSKRPVALVVATSASPPAPPCGLCLEFLRELAEDLPVLLLNTDGEERRYRLGELLPVPFNRPSEP